MDQQITSGDANAARAESQWETYRKLFAPVEERMVQDANTFDSPRTPGKNGCGGCGRRYTAPSGSALEANQRAMERMGVNPSSGKYQSITLDSPGIGRQP